MREGKEGLEHEVCYSDSDKDGKRDTIVERFRYDAKGQKQVLDCFYKQEEPYKPLRCELYINDKLKYVQTDFEKGLRDVKEVWTEL
ncbi:MAG: hypothetical protein KKA62_05115 [Nanoarchaeota archaeon]|nr:hypothetical protein [Nanoarchaeota archaeon]MBU1644060.1 hypothetical protein [Nanoarchaeota archaeon]MBU1977302.1 hypothetical protein [Nanoarchaeota archaeon]